MTPTRGPDERHAGPLRADDHTVWSRFSSSSSMSSSAPRLANTGPVTRDLLASGRTFLAGTRTGRGSIALGVALEKVEALARLQLEQENARVAAGVLVASGSACVAHGTARYFTVMKNVREGALVPNRVGIAGLSAVSTGMALAGTLLVVGKDSSRAGRVRAAETEGAKEP